ncbi:hypothetical protein F5Y16DRAFT_191007 [Xylariaceae sp. FL0255]|nr:hypothetical protein F5Y16DRAFT_191007 [Xylariaceae sp. FL0255]
MAERHLSEMSVSPGNTYNDDTSLQSHQTAGQYIPPQQHPQHGVQQQQAIPQPVNTEQPQQMAYAQQPYTAQAPGRQYPLLNKGWIGTRIALTAISIVLAIIILGLTAALTASEWASFVALYGFVIAAVSIIWNSAELITYCVRVRKQTRRGIHPGAHVALHLVFWLVGILAIIFTVFILLSTADYTSYCQNEIEYDEEYPEYSYDDDCEDQLNSLNNVVYPELIALTVFFGLWLIDHFVLFVLACIETSRRNALKAMNFAMPPSAMAQPQPLYYLPAPGAAPMPMQYYPAHNGYYAPQQQVPKPVNS